MIKPLLFRSAAKTERSAGSVRPANTGMIDIKDDQLSVVDKKLRNRLIKINRYYDLDKVVTRSTDNRDIAKYYRKSDFFYNWIHSKGEEAIHFGLSEDGQHHKEDFSGQADYVGTFITEPSMRVLEIGAGRLMNTRRLAGKFPETSFYALDLPNRNFLKNKDIPGNVTLVEGDFHDLSNLPRESFDIVFGVETVCHSNNKKKVYEEVSSVLKPGGTLIIFDGFEPSPKAEMSELRRYCDDVLLYSMRVPSEDFYIGDAIGYMKSAGITDVQAVNITNKVLPSAKRLERISAKYFNRPYLVRILSALISSEVTLNSIAGYMFYPCYKCNILQYYRVTAKKPVSP